MSRSDDRNARITRLVRPAVQAVQAYHVPPAQGMVKLDAMENPYPWPGELRDDWLAVLADVTANRYPDPTAAALKAQLRRDGGVPDAAGLLLGNGSDELIQLLALALGGEGRVVMAPGPGFAMYRLIAAFTGLEYQEVPLSGDDFALDQGAMLAAIARHQPAVIYLAYPNNPTGNAFDAAAMEAVIEAAPGVVVIDEAYEPFCGRTWMSALERYDHLLVMRTVSKMGLAGLRLGYLAGHPDWLVQLEKCRLPYNINVLTQASAAFALEHGDRLRAQTEALRVERERLFEALCTRPGLRVWPSEANFITFRAQPGQAGGIHASLRESGVLIKNLDGSHPLLSDCLRVTVGRAEENARFLTALDAVIG
ncbi:histidinol-phosphate transaminase [Aquisalimonas sp.]|uniref:histidinol-phosphate transaminase n=1 Tax=unclassified Aquisalimonas TaxID=2644645 RepID=UPI0025BF2C86|nr:histidinol-phosphate transaminase [Aquisalimonas sp.]